MRRKLDRTTALFAVVAWGLAAGVASAQQAAEWPQYRGNAGHTGVSPDGSVKPPLKLLWSYRTDTDTSGDAGAGLIVAGGKVFANIFNTRSILALEADTGRFAWETTDRGLDWHMTPTYDDGLLYYASLKDKALVLRALDAASGRQKWERPLAAEGRDARRSGPVVSGGRVFYAEGGEEPAAFALDGKTGEVVWRTPLGKEDGTGVGAPTVAGGRVFVCTRSHYLFSPCKEAATVALDEKTGAILWRRKGFFSERPPASDGTAVLCATFRSPERGFHFLDAATGTTLWTNPSRTDRICNTPIITPEQVFVKLYGNALAMDRKDGKALWTSKVPSTSCCNMSISGNYGYFGSGAPDGNDSETLQAWRGDLQTLREKGMGWSLYAVDLKTGDHSLIFQGANNFCGDPAIAYGRLYCNSRDGWIYCFAPAKPGEPTVPEAKDKAPNASAEEVRKLLAPELADRPRPGLDWPMQGGSPDRAGLEGMALQPPLELAWTLDTGGRIRTAAAIRDGRVFVGSLSGKIVAADLATGAKAWEFQIGGEVRCSPAVAGGLVFCGSNDGRFYALSAADGKKRWEFECGGPVEASPAVVGGMVIFGANDHTTYALDRATGRKLWSFRSEHYGQHAPPVVHGDRVFVGQRVDWTHALDIATGRPQWRSFASMSIESLAYHRDRLYVRTPYWVAELDPSSGKRLRMSWASYGYGGVGFMKNLLLVSGIQSQYGTNGTTAVDLDVPGEPLKQPLASLEGLRQLTPKGLVGSTTSMGVPLGLGDTFCIAAVSGETGLFGRDGKKLWSAKLGGTCHSTPVTADGVLVVGCDDGMVYAFRGKR